jgi:integrase
MAHVEDRWFRSGPDGKAKIRTARHGAGRRWRVRYLDPAGRERGRTFERRGDADAFRDSTAADVRRGHYTDPSSGKETLRTFAESWLAARKWEASTAESVEVRLRKHILPVLGGHTLAQLAGRPSIIQAWLAGLPVSDASARLALTTLSAIMKTAVTDGLIVRNPCSAVQRPKASTSRVEPWSAEQVAAVRAALPGPYRVLADLGSGLGLRQGEAFGLAVGDINFLRRVVHVRRQVRIVRGRLVYAAPKGGKQRDVPLPETVALALAAHLEQHPARPVPLPWLDGSGQGVTAQLLLTSPTGAAVNRNWFNSHLWKPALKAAGMPTTRENGTHALRHHFASVLLHHGCDIKSVSEYLGHHSAAFTLAVYAHVMPTAHDRMREAIDAAHNQDHVPVTAQGSRDDRLCRPNAVPRYFW